ncbi:MAG: pyridoxal-phosphate dependent enzyme, partial [Granulosicoccaceae bacterium]
VAWGCGRFGASCHIYIHAEVSQGRADAMAALGATVVRVDGNYDASVRAAQQAADDNGWFVVSDTSYEGYTQVPSQVMAGYGVMVEEVI